MRIGIATDHGGFSLKEQLLSQLREAGHEVVDFGAHHLSKDDDYPDYVLPLAQAVAAGGIRSRVVSMPSWDIFEHQTEENRDSALPPHVQVRVAVEQASTFGWERYVGRAGCVIGMKTFGASAPLKELQRKFGFEPDQVASAAKQLLRS